MTLLLTVTLILAWLLSAGFVCAFVHGAALLRKQEDDMLASQLAPVVVIARPDATESARIDLAAA